MSRILVTGATGTLGRAVCEALIARGDQVTALTRSADHARSSLGEQVDVSEWRDPMTAPPPEDALAASDGVIHLLGEPVAQRWSAGAKERIRDSRVLGTRMLVEGLRRVPERDRPRVLVSQSAAGFYGASDDRELDESAPNGNDFLAGVVREWEQEAHRADDLARVVTTRTGVALTPSGGALAKMLPFFKLGIGGPVAGGRQYVPWIHADDVVAGLLFCMDETQIVGPVNLSAPQPVTNAELSRALGRALHRPAFLPVPALALRVLYGEMASIVLTGQRVVPRALEAAGYSFRHPELEPALRDVIAG